MTISPSADNIAAIITVYEPPPTLKEAIKRLMPQVQCVILVDNGSNDAFRAWALKLGQKVEWVDNPQNGLAKAQNLGVEKARSKKAKWLLLLDDDSLPAEDMLPVMEQEWQRLSSVKQQKVGILGAHIKEMALPRAALYIRPWLGVWFKRVGFDKETRQLHNLFYVCASGSLLRMEVLEQVGTMREPFFIYFIDTEFCLRMRRHGYDICAVRDAKLTHRIGHRTSHKIGRLIVSTTNHGPLARYYMYRNRRHLWWEYALREPGYVGFDLIRCGSELLRILLFERQKCHKLLAIIRGVLGLSVPKTGYES